MLTTPLKMSQAISKELADARQTAASIRFDIESDEHLITSPNDADVRSNLHQEFSHLGQRKTSEVSLHMPHLQADLSAQDISIKEQISILQLQRVELDQTSNDAHMAALEARLAAREREVGKLTSELGKEQQAREAAEVEVAKLGEKNKQLRSTLDHQLHQTEMLNSVVKGPSQQGDLKRQILQAIEQTETAKFERDAALAQVASLEKELAAPGTADRLNLSMHESSLRKELGELNEKRTAGFKSQLTALEMDKKKLEYELTASSLKLKEAVFTIDSISRRHGIVQVQHEEVERERDVAHVQIKALKAQIADARLDAAHHRGRITDPNNSDSASRSSSRFSRGPDAELEDALDQRDDAIAQYRTLLQAQANSGGSLQLAQALEKIRVLESEIINASEQHRHANRDLRLAMERMSQVEMTAAKTIKQLEGDLRQAIAQTSIRGDNFTSMEAMRLIRSKQFQAKIHRKANEDLRIFAEREAEVSQNPAATRVLISSDVSSWESMPPNWQAMISPEGLEYYVDHTRQVTTWHHPGYPNSDQLLTAASLASPAPLMPTSVNNPDDSSRPTTAAGRRAYVDSSPVSRTSNPNVSWASSGDRSIHPKHKALNDKLGSLRQKSVSRGIGSERIQARQR